MPDIDETKTPSPRKGHSLGQSIALCAVLSLATGIAGWVAGDYRGRQRAKPGSAETRQVPDSTRNYLLITDQMGTQTLLIEGPAPRGRYGTIRQFEQELLENTIPAATPGKE